MQPPVNAPSKSKNNVALIVVLSSCGCAFLMIPIVAAILFPVFAQAREKARATTCLSNVKQLSLAVLMYTQDNDEEYPAAKDWMTKTQGYVKTPSIYYCPSVHNQPAGEGGVAYGYAYNSALSRLAMKNIPSPSGTPMLYDSSTLTMDATDALTSLPVPPRHSGRNVISFGDGHCSLTPPERLDWLLQNMPQPKKKK